MRLVLRSYQSDGVGLVRAKFLSGNRRVIYCLPTGGGKTPIFTHIAEQSSKKGKRVIILVHRQELLLQCSRHLTALGVPHGRVAPGHSMTRDHIQVASVQALVRRLDKYASPDLIIIDEAHHATAGSWRKVISHWEKSFVLGVTATPTRTDGQGLGITSGGVFDSLILGPSVGDLIAMGYLTEPIVYAPKTDLDLSGLRSRMGDYEKEELVKRVDKPKITGSAVEHYRKLCNGVPAIAFCASVEHAKHVAADFSSSGYRAKSLDGKMGDLERKQIIEDLGAGKIDILTSCEIVSEGTDIPVVGAAILLRPTQSTGLYLQQVGRALRPYPGKSKTIILDHAGNVLRHGLPDDDREWTLEGVKKKKKKSDEGPDIQIRQCPKCYVVHRPAPVCPTCGHVYEIKARKVEEEDGELVKFDAEKLKKRREIGMAKSLEDLEEIARRRGYKSGWANFVWRARQQKMQRTA